MEGVASDSDSSCGSDNYITFNCRKCPGKTFQKTELEEHNKWHKEQKRIVGEAAAKLESSKQGNVASSTPEIALSELAVVELGQKVVPQSKTNNHKGPAATATPVAELFEVSEASDASSFEEDESDDDEPETKRSRKTRFPKSPSPTKRETSPRNIPAAIASSSKAMANNPNEWGLPGLGRSHTSLFVDREFPTARIVPCYVHFEPQTQEDVNRFLFDHSHRYQPESENDYHSWRSYNMEVREDYIFNEEEGPPYMLGTINLKLDIGDAPGAVNFDMDNTSTVFPKLSIFSIYSPVYFKVSRDRDNRLAYSASSRPPRAGAEYRELLIRRFIFLKTKAEEDEEEKYKEETEITWPTSKKKPCPASKKPKPASGKGLFCYSIVGCDEGFDLDWFIGLSNSNIFSIDLVRFDCQTKLLTLAVMLKHSFVKGTWSHDLSELPEVKLNIPKILSFFFGVEGFDKFVGQIPKEDIPWFFRQVKAFHDTEVLEEFGENFQHPFLHADLRDYQRRAVHWMLYKEGQVINVQETQKEDLVETFLNKMYHKVELKSKDGLVRVAYFNRFLGYIFWERPIIAKIPNVGILADEMGLGKTVEMLTLILMHPRPSVELISWKGETLNSFGAEEDTEEVDAANPLKCFCKVPPIGEDILTCSKCKSQQHPACVNYKKNWKKQRNNFEYICPFCIQSQPPVLSKTTLIITPYNICQQWMDEINRHIDTDQVKVAIYEGINYKNPLLPNITYNYWSPELLASYDVILTSYDVLKSENKYLGGDGKNMSKMQQRSRRHPQRYFTPPSPLPYVNWWRICLDEAQTIQGVENNMSKMAQLLEGSQRWCITGTPMSRGVEDLLGQISFLGIEPINERRWWEYLILEPYYRRDQSLFYQLFGQLIWRNEKQDIEENDLNIPPQTIIDLPLKFSGIEDYFYRRVQECSGAAVTGGIDYLVSKRMIKRNTKLSEIARKTLILLMEPFEKLRFACSHSQLVSQSEGGNANAFGIIKQKSKTYTIQDVRVQLVKEAEEDAKKQMTAFFRLINRLACKYYQHGLWKEAAASYKKILQYIEKHENLSIRSANLEAINNLMELHDGENDFKLNKTEVTKFKSFQEQLKAQYMEETLGTLKWEEEALNLQTTLVENLVSKFEEEGENIIAQYIDKIVLPGKSEQKERFSADQEIEYLMDSFSTEMKNLICARNEILDFIKSLEQVDFSSENLSSLVIQDSLQPFEEGLFIYAKILFGENIEPIEKWVLRKKHPVKWESMTGTDQEKVLRDLQEEFQRQLDTQKQEPESNFQNTIINLGTFSKTIEMNFTIFREMKNEFYGLQTYLTAFRDLKTTQSEWKPQPAPKAIKSQSSAKPNNDKLEKRIETHTIKLDKQVGKLRFLENLKEQETEIKCCHICYLENVDTFYLLNCGHKFCIDCGNKIIPSEETLKLWCPFCRMEFTRKEMQKVTTKTIPPSQRERPVANKPRHPRRVGDYSAKVDAIVETLLELQDTHPGEKALLFSQLPQFLEIIATALTRNKILFIHHNASKAKNVMTIQNFKTDPNIQVLLMPIIAGSKGLNLTEATHVLLSEPIMKRADEVQAMGRVHRVGQTKETFVYRFYMKDSVEQYLFDTLQSKPGDETESLTVEDLEKSSSAI